MQGKVVHLIGQLRRGGAEKQLTCLARALKDRGWPQAVVSFNQGGYWKKRLEEMNVPVLEVPRTPLKPLRLLRLFRLMRREKPRILLSWSEHVAVYAQCLRGIGNPKMIYNVRINPAVDTDTGEPSDKLARYRGAMEKADHVVSNSKRALDVLRQHGVRISGGSVIHNIVFAEGRATADEAVAAPRVVAVGSLIKRKAFDVLLHALASLDAEGMKFSLSLVGDGPEGPALKELTSRLGLADCVEFTGKIADVPGLMAGAHIVVHPSLHEGLSNTVLEGMAEGLPVVATAIEGNTEIIESGRSGILVPPGEAEPLADAIRELLQDSALRGSLGEAALRRVREMCNETTVVESYERVFHSLLSDETESKLA